MNDIKANLQVIQNVGENIILMDQKIREKVEHQLKSELEKSVQECMVDRMKTIEDQIENIMED